jgi:hypothetical protein
MGTTYPSPAALVTPFVSNASIQVAPPNLQRRALYVFNPSSTITLAVMPTGTVAAIANGIIIQPQQGMIFGPPNTESWTAGMNAIASSAGSNVIVILEFYQ